LRPISGKLFFNDVAYDEYDINSIRSQIGYVTQESVIFNDTIVNNITLWDENIDMSRVIRCAKQALAYDFIMDKPGQFEEYLGNDGVNLSGGQRQRIVIARELYKNSQLLIFDEATSALDSKSESQIQKSILELKGKKTIIIITHRLSSLKNCANIFLLKDGSVTDSGSFDELVKSSKTFNNMFKAQNL
jgi:subfamily B ATP-binding cassette protein MsbA